MSKSHTTTNPPGIPNYGVLIGTITDKMDCITAKSKTHKSDLHYEIRVMAGGTDYRLAVNVQSDDKSSLQVFIDDDYKHPIVDQLKTMVTNDGFHPLKKDASSVALDFVHGNLFPFSKLRVIPPVGSSSSDDLNDLFELHVAQAMNTTGAKIFAFGSGWPSKPHEVDEYFGFSPAVGVHDIHMNQGNPPHQHDQDNGSFQDGAIFIFYPDESRWTAYFSKFQTQKVDQVGTTPVSIPAGPTPAPSPTPIPVPVSTGADGIQIFAALLNPIGDDKGKEKVYLLNAGSASVNLDGWAIVDKAGNKDTLHGIIIDAGDTRIVTLTGDGAQLSNKGGLITLVNKSGGKVDGVAFTKAQASREGVVVRF